ncbi:hypothetical protein [Clostridium sp. C8]|uniref:hypothetical protein n=1 Tax=Clostridium sp. C8 TaxID=1667357 RepID=UPI000B0236E3|nr:hypothetical protein [Clostridium sp. C8]
MGLCNIYKEIKNDICIDYDKEEGFKFESFFFILIGLYKLDKCISGIRNEVYK